MSYGFIYITTNLINGKKYIGKRVYRKGWESYLGSGVALKKSISKYGRENFSREIIEECGSQEELSSAEIKWIKHFNAVEDCMYYNISYGGDGSRSGELHHLYGKKHSKQTKVKMSAKAKLRIGEKNPFYGKSHSLETKEKIKHVQSGRVKTLSERKAISRRTKGKNNPMYGLKHTQEAIEKNRIAHLGKKMSPDARRKMSESSTKKRAVICLNNGMVFESLAKASVYADRFATNIQQCCKGIKKSSGKDELTGEPLRWKYYDEYLNAKSTQ